MTIKATVKRVFQYTPIGKPAQTISNVIARMEFPQAVELDSDISDQVEGWYLRSADVKYALGAEIVITYEEV